ncbi:hypothetical protein ACAM_0098 [Aeropyrum camini SY1 = JCM 12091]|uniref:DUF4350 domain-containing protein n=1 Tax=Aeropyrum camini SY1 = JCM 12091 TaxID=1198449 RepID=U3T7S1_9CREN|nr:hypothetical protein ACAM_0098 [Aeropyrum camini SY1 = JCM 12091]
MLATLVIIIAILGSMEIRPRAIVLSIATPSDAPLPYNDGPLGASEFASSLENMGYKILILPEVDDVARLLSTTMEERIVVMVIGADSMRADVLSRLLKILAKNGENKVSLIYADEQPLIPLDSVEWRILQTSFCGWLYYSLGEVEPAESLIVSSSDGSVSVLTGFASPLVIEKYGGISYASKPPGGEEVFLYAWPSLGEVKGFWYSLGGVCGDEDRLIVIGDSTMFLNNYYSRGEGYRKMASLVMDKAAPEDNATVVFLQELYISERDRVNIAVLLAPSVLLTAAADLYASLEGGIRAFIGETPLKPAFVGSVALFLLAVLPLFIKGRRRQAG